MVVQDNHSQDLVSSPLKNDKKHRLKQRFDVQKKLGQGTYGKVQLAVNRETGQEVAIKTIKKVKIESEQDLIRIRREIQIMSSIQHPHIIHIYEVFENKDKIVLVMQFASGGELYDYLSEKKVLSDLEARRIFRQIAAAVYYCHKNKICHRDLKLENILLDEKGNAKIADFGLSNVFDERHLLKTYCGSPLYASPEIVKGVPYYGPEVDCWSMGVLLYTLVYGAMPFDGSNFKKLVTQISEGDYFEPKKKSKASGLIRKLLTVNPVKRATIVDICTDYWVNQGYEHSLLQVAEDMANLTPVRLDLLLALAPVSPIPPHESELQEQRDVEGTDSNTAPDNSIPEKDTEEEEEQEDDDEDDDDNPETMANSFAYVRGSHTSNLSASSPNLPEASTRFDDEEDEFLPVDIAAALQSQCSKRCAERSFDGSLVRISSLAHKSKKPRKSDSSTGVKNNKTDTKVGGQAASNSNIHTERLDKENSNNVNEKSNEVQCMQEVAQNKHTLEKINSEDSSKAVDSQENVNKSLKATARNNDKSSELLKSSSNVQKTGIIQEQVSIKQNVENKDSQKTILPSNCNERKKSLDILQKRDSFSTQKDKPELEAKKMGRHPGKIIIPKTFDSPQSTPSPKLQGVKKLSPDVKENSSETKIINVDPKVQTGEKLELLNKADTESDKDDSPKENELIDFNEENTHNITETEPISEEKKTLAKGILKKGIAKAKLAERKLSQQSSIESEVLTPPTSSIHTPDGGPPSFFKAPKPYSKEEKPHIKSKAEIIFTPSVKRTNSVKSDDTLRNTNSSIWDTASFSKDKQMQNKDLSWSAISSTLDSEMSNWREQMEESLRRLSPDEDEKSPSPVNNSKNDDDKPLVPIARSYKKFTFTKDGACITETKKIYATPCADGSWTKVEKKTKITTRPGNAEEFEKFRDLHLRNDSPLTRSDSQSSSGSNEMYDDIFDSWTGDTALCNVMKMKNLFQKFSRDPFLRTERRRNPFRQFRRTESERNDRTRRRTELRSGHSTDRESSDNEEDYDVHFDGSNPIVYGSQGLWQLLRSANKGFPGRVTVTHHDPLSYSRSVSQDRSESKLSNWKQNESRASSGYNTGSRCHSRDRTQSPREKVLRFVFETPTQENAKGSGSKSPPSKQDSWSFRRNSSRHNPRRDSGVTSDGYESEHSVRRIPSDDLSKSKRVSPLSSIYSGGRHDMIRDFVRSWSKDMGSPPGSPSSFHQDAANEKTSNLADSRRHRVEQWLQMNDINNPNFPFGFHGDRHSIMSSRKPSAHSNTSSSYATMRPREYMRYNRSSSDKIPDHDIDYFPSFEESHRSTSTHNLQNKESGSLSEASKAKARTLYSPVSEESSKETHSLRHSDSSHSGSSMHRINFTISDGRISSSHTPPPTRYVQAFSDPTGGQTVVSSRSGNVKVEQVPARSPGQPLVQMRVSFNRGNRDNQVVHVTSQLPQESKGLWQHQDPQNNARTLNIQNTSNRETSPVPGIRKFSTEMVHSVGIAAEGQNVSDVRQKRHSNIENSSTSSLEYEVKSVGRSSSDSLHKGKQDST